MRGKPNPAGAFRATTSFMPAGPPGTYPRMIQAGDLLAEDDPLVKSHRALLQPVSEFIEQTTQSPGEVRPMRLPSGVTQEQAIRNRTEETAMPHALPPEDEDSPASPFAPMQPGAGVVADDVPAEQNPAGGPKAAEAGPMPFVPPEPQTPLQEAQVEALKDDQKETPKKSSK